MARNPLATFRNGGPFGGGFDPMFSLHREMNRLFDDFMGGPSAGGQGQSSGGNIINAHINVSETDGEIRISAELPGVAEQDIDVSLNDDVLTIRGEKKFERSDDKENFHFVERSYGTFQRSLRLPFSVDPEQVRAEFENGVLNVTLPKSAQQERSRRIQVQRAHGSTRQIEQSGSAAGAGEDRSKSSANKGGTSSRNSA